MKCFIDINWVPKPARLSLVPICEACKVKPFNYSSIALGSTQGEDVSYQLPFLQDCLCQFKPCTLKFTEYQPLSRNPPSKETLGLSLNPKKTPGDGYISFPGRTKELKEESVYTAESLYTAEKKNIHIYLKE